jgi:Arc/MetJ-type ribon-helix-helix transcriptional regulator
MARKKPQRKERITVYVSPYLYKEIQEMINRGDFSSESDVGYQALSAFVNEYKKEKRKKSK